MAMHFPVDHLRWQYPFGPYHAFAFRGATLRFVQGFLLSPDVIRAAASFIDTLVERDALQIAIAARMPLERIVEAHQMVEGGTGIGNFVVEVIIVSRNAHWRARGVWKGYPPD
jgi:hypothetical protein